MKTAYIFRTEESDHGTAGVFTCPQVGFSAFSLELPWRDNKVRMSCIPTGTYTCIPYQSPKFGLVFHVTDVKGRTYILFHSLNFAGDTTKGWKTHSHGCIGLGKSRGWIGNQRAILNSRIAVTEFQRKMTMEPFKLIIQ